MLGGALGVALEAEQGETAPSLTQPALEEEEEEEEEKSGSAQQLVPSQQRSPKDGPSSAAGGSKVQRNAVSQAVCL